MWPHRRTGPRREGEWREKTARPERTATQGEGAGTPAAGGVTNLPRHGNSVEQRRRAGERRHRLRTGDGTRGPWAGEEVVQIAGERSGNVQRCGKERKGKPKAGSRGPDGCRRPPPTPTSLPSGVLAQPSRAGSVGRSVRHWAHPGTQCNRQTHRLPVPTRRCVAGRRGGGRRQQAVRQAAGAPDGDHESRKGARGEQRGTKPSQAGMAWAGRGWAHKRPSWGRRKGWRRAQRGARREEHSPGPRNQQAGTKRRGGRRGWRRQEEVRGPALPRGPAQSRPVGQQAGAARRLHRHRRRRGRDRAPGRRRG